jgi:ubiquinone/menaquinone biosynthesis C-methylase UbiE
MIGTLTVTLLEHVLDSPRLYDRVQKIFGLDELRRRVGSVLAHLDPGILLDVGAGTANFYSVVPDDFEYIALDPDDKKLMRVRQKYPDVQTVLGSGTRLPFNDAEIDYTLCIDVSHHLRDDALEQLVDELARITRRKLIFVDALEAPRPVSKLLWAIDRGSHPRSLDALRRRLEQRFIFEQFGVFTIQHAYMMAVAAVRTTTSA